MDKYSTLPPLKKVIADHQLSARKALGQHFLLDTRITDKIVKYAGDVKDYNIIEIGPGPGGLTRSLLKAGARKVYAIEKDIRALDALLSLKEAAGEQLELLHADALEVDLTALVPPPRKIVANLPYNVGTAMLLGWLDKLYLEGPQAFASLTLMFQKEVAQRIVADPGGKDYGKLSVLAQWLAECRWDMDLPPGAFSPPPKVHSAVITLTPRSGPLIMVKKESLEKLLGAAFGQRRKMLRSALKPLNRDVERMLQKAGVLGTVRAEQLDVITLCRLALAYQSLKA